MNRDELEGLLLGAWRIIKILNAGEALEREEDDEQFLWLLEEKIVTGDEWAAWDMPYKLKSDHFPIEIDVTRDDLNESFIDKGLIEVSNQEIKICMSGEEGRPRPSDFTSTPENGQTLYVGIRCNEPLPE